MSARDQPEPRHSEIDPSLCDCPDGYQSYGVGKYKHLPSCRYGVIEDWLDAAPAPEAAGLRVDVHATPEEQGLTPGGERRTFDEEWADLLREFPTNRDAKIRELLDKHRLALRPIRQQYDDAEAVIRHLHAHIEQLENEALAPPQPDPQDRWRLVRVATDMLSQFGTRTEAGERLTAEWGEPDEQGVYEPIFTVHPAPPQPDRAELDAAWAEAEAALPEGWGIGIEPSSRGYEAGAGRNQWFVWDGAAHPTPAEALRALAARLRERA